MAVPRGRLNVSGPRGNRIDEFDLVRTTANALHQRGHEVAASGDTLVHASGLVIKPLLVDLQLLPDGGVRTVTTIDVTHPMFNAPRIYEYQHSAGDDMVKSLFKGIDMWVQIDFPVYFDALRDSPANSTYMDMSLPADATRPIRVRRTVLGPVGSMQQKQSPQQADEPHSSSCPCCMLTNSFEAFQPYLRGDGFFAIRLFAMRNEKGAPQADCRINGDEYEPGKEALLKYVDKWPQRGIEFRKQYVIIIDAPSLSANAAMEVAS
jgi:hypothetical protein